MLDFESFFYALHEISPFPWQSRLAEMAVAGEWPEGMNLPTASGKTACVDIAVFALAKQLAEGSTRSAPLRTVFVVNRRVIVDEAFSRADKIAKKLADAERNPEAAPVLREAAKALRKIAGEGAPAPLGAHLMRGGVFRSESWLRHPTQPQILCSTVDMAGSRLLFRGYGVSDNAKPLAAGLLGQDALWLLDEAHLSKPFAETLAAVQRFGEQGVTVVGMTATPDAANAFELSEADRSHALLGQRWHASKPAQLLGAPTARGSGWQCKLAKIMSQEAVRLRAGQPDDHQLPRSVAVICNRVDTARETANLLAEHVRKKKTGEVVHLVTGRMRPIDRDRLTEILQQDLALKSGADASNAPACYVVATQCLEAGADFDFDAMVTELASLDALRQRFGRLNRLGRPIEASAVVVASGEMLKETGSGDPVPDAIYGLSGRATWDWLQGCAGADSVVDFGLASMDQLQKLQPPTAPLAPPSEHAPILLPTHLDLLCRTSPRPKPDPDVAPFLHGPRDVRADVSVVWRSDLSDDLSEEDLCIRVAAMPPTAGEAMPVPLYEAQRFLDGLSGGSGGDVEGEDSDASQRSKKGIVIHSRKAVLWRETEAKLLEGGRGLRPGDVVVLPTQIGGWSILGSIPNQATDPTADGDVDFVDFTSIDCAEITRLNATARLVLRTDTARPWYRDVEHLLGEDEPPVDEIRQTLSECGSLPEALRHASLCVRRWRRVPIGDGSWQLVGLDRVPLRSSDTEEAELPHQNLAVDKPVALFAHCQAVADCAKAAAMRLGFDPPIQACIYRAGLGHDWGKADLRFQAVLRGGNPWAVGAGLELLAKSGQLPASYQAYELLRQRAGLPKGFRHELVSVRLLEAYGENDPLILHLVASHHGRCRASAPAIDDPHPVTVRLVIGDAEFSCSSDTQLELIGSGVTRRFWQCLRTHGWWGLARLEAILRLADQHVSHTEQLLSTEDQHAVS